MNKAVGLGQSRITVILDKSSYSCHKVGWGSDACSNSCAWQRAFKQTLFNHDVDLIRGHYAYRMISGSGYLTTMNCVDNSKDKTKESAYLSWLYCREREWEAMLVSS
jgi:hypothetical protein